MEQKNDSSSSAAICFTVLTIFPEMFVPFWNTGIVRRAIELNKVQVSAINIRDFAQGRHKTTDDRPYGGGSGMVMKPEPLALSIRAAKQANPFAQTILLTPQGRVFNQTIAQELSSVQGVIFVCGRYEGVDERICYEYIDEELSIGDYILTGGETAAMVIMDAVIRLIPGVLGGEDSAEKESFSKGLLEHAHFTRPRIFEGNEVPEILMSGHHQRIETWRMESALIRTFLKRPDLLENRKLSEREIDILKSWCSRIDTIIKSQSKGRIDSLSGDRENR